MTTYRIDHDTTPGASFPYAVVDAAGDVWDNFDTLAEAEEFKASREHDDECDRLREKVENKLYDLDLETLRKIAALL